MASTSDDLFAAIAAGDIDGVRAVLEDDPSLAGARDHEGVSALLRARYRLDPDLTQVVRSRAGELDVFEAAAFGDTERLTALLAADPSLVASRSADGFAALHLAAYFGGEEVATRLLDAGAEVDVYGTGWMQGTPLHSAASAARIDVVEVLLAAGADVNARQAGGSTPLHSAAAHGDVDLIGVLLAAGADPDSANDDGRSPRDMTENEAALAALGQG